LTLGRSTHPDTIAVGLLTTRLAMSRSAEVRPLGPTAWSSLRLRLTAAGDAPSALIGLDATGIASRLDLPQDRAGDLASLLARVGQLSLELERLQGRGIWMLSREDVEYPESLARRLGDQAPPVLFGSGEVSMLSEKAIGMVGSRDADASALQFTERLAEWAVRGGLAVVSGAARGVDSVAMRAAFTAGGKVAGVLAESLEQRIRDTETRRAVAEGKAVFISPYGPATPFSVGAAMGRNKLIYCLSTAVVVVAATKGSGGTWAGAEEALRAHWVPVVFRVSDHPSPADQALSAMGAHAISDADLSERLAADFVTRLVIADNTSRPLVIAEEPMQYPMFGLPVALPAKGRRRKGK
jgi:predicted Rossmann fold nucleotide-binding protein DprA/Smf involved in DNA uptake